MEMKAPTWDAGSRQVVDLQLVVLDHAVGITFLHFYERVLDALHVVDR